YIAQMDWASGGFFRWGARLKLGPWKYYDRTYGRNYVLELNQFMAAMIGQIRIARMVGDAQAEAEGWHALAQVAMLRLVVAKSGLHGTCDERGIFGGMVNGQYSMSFLDVYFD